MRAATIRRAAVVAAATGLLAGAAPGLAAVTAEPPELVSESLSGQSSNGGGGIPRISADGRYVAFGSSGDDLVPGDTNGVIDVFVRDLTTGEVERVSVSSDGVQADEYSSSPQISADGRYVGFSSSSTTLVAEELEPGPSHYFIRDRWSDQTRVVLIRHEGREAYVQSLFASLSGNGRFLAFVSSDDLVPGDDDGDGRDIYRVDLETMEVQLVTVAPEGRPSQLWSDRPSVSYSGRFVAFESSARLVARDRNGERDVYVRDMLKQRTQLVSVSSREVGGDKGARAPAISAGGRYVVFSSWASTLVPGDTNRKSDVFIRDRRLGTTHRVSVSSNERQGNRQTHGESTFIGSAAVSADGRFVAFNSLASNFVRGDTNDTLDVFVRDRAEGTTSLMSEATDGSTGNGTSSWAVLAADGSRAAFSSAASDLVPNDMNDAGDVFVRRLGG
jgi:Tol biopolymer transport system component